MSKTPISGTIEIFIDEQSQGIYSINDPYKIQVQEIIFEKHNLENKEHRLKIVKKSGKTISVDLIGYQ